MSEDNDKYRRIPQRADDPVPILFWDPFEFVLAVCSFGLLMIFANPMVGMLVGIFVLWAGKKLKAGTKRGAAQHAIWSTGLMADKGMVRFPPAWWKDLVE